MQTYVDTSKSNLEQSSFEFTESPFDIGIQGNVYFNIQGTNGNVYQTRCGQFELDGEGYLCEIYIGNDDFIVDNEGNILNENGEVIEKLRLSYIPENADVTKVGNNLFSYDGAMTIPEGEKYDIIQGCFEKSNVDANKEITSLMETQRLFEASSAVLKYMDTINGRAASEIIKL